MRPVNKLNPGDTVEVMLADGTVAADVIRAEYEDYTEAKAPLVAHLGCYCSYCECRLDERSLQVEHIEPKHLSGETGNPYYLKSWNNFLLSVPPVMAGITKGLDMSCHRIWICLIKTIHL